MSLLSYPDRTVLLSPSYLGTVDYWALLCAFGEVVIDNGGRFNKRLKSTHRCVIADVNGSLTLTVPLEKPKSLTAARWNTVKLSAHGEWWHQHRVALESAYGATPFFEYYAPEFEPFFNRATLSEYPTLTDYDTALTLLIARMLGVEGKLRFSDQTIASGEAFDFRETRLPRMEPVPYYQVRSSQLGFILHLSVVDLIFNMGPEAPLILKQIIYNTKI